MPVHPSDDDLLEELLLRYESTQENGAQHTIADLCKTHPHLEGRLRREIALLNKLSDNLERTTAQPSRPAPRGRFDAVGRYKPERTIGQGALGEVLLATDTELHRQVALKRLLFKAHAGDGRLRFLVEAQVTSRLDHPGVVPVHGLVYDDDKNPHYAMRLIRGESLDAAIARFHRDHPAGSSSANQATDLQTLLRSFLAICQTVAYAHSQGFLHRDLKPENVMVGKYGETLVVDWGLAKRISGDDAGDLEATSGALPEQDEALDRQIAELDQTVLGQRKGSPAYMSPEQAAGRWSEVGPASDIYSLGATLYKLLTGQLPFKDPKRVFQQIAAGDYPRPRELRGDIPFGLEAICLKAMAVKPSDRYTTALEMAADIERWLADEPVLAAPEPWTLRWQRWFKRWQAWILGGVAAALVALFGVIGVAQQRQWAAEQVAEEQENAAKKIAGERDQAQANLLEAKRNLYLARMTLVNNAMDEAKYDRARDLLLAERPLPGELDDRRSMEWFDIWHELHHDVVELKIPTNPYHGHLSLDGKRMAVMSTNTVELWDLTTGEMTRRIKEEPKLADVGQAFSVVEFSSNLRWLIRFKKSLPRGCMELISPAADPLRAERLSLRPDEDAEPVAAAFSQDEQKLAVLWSDGKLQAWRLADKSLLQAGDLAIENLVQHQARLAFSPEGDRLAIAYWVQAKTYLAAIWNLSQEIEFRVQTTTIAADLAWFGERPVLAGVVESPDSDPRLTFTELAWPEGAARDSVPLLSVRESYVSKDLDEFSAIHLAAGPEKSTVALVKGDRELHLVAQAADGALRIGRPRTHIHLMGLSGDWLWTLDAQGRAVVSKLDDVLNELTLADRSRRIDSLVALRDQRWLALTVRRSERADQKLPQTLLCLDRTGRIRWSVDLPPGKRSEWENLDGRLKLSADGSLVGVLDQFDAAWLTVAEGRLVRGEPAPVMPSIVVPSPDGNETWKAAAIDYPHRRSARSQQSSILIADAKGIDVASPGGFQGTEECTDLAFSSDGRLLAAGGAGGQIQVWRTEDWQRQLSATAHLDFVKHLAFWPGNERFLSAGFYSPRVILWDLPRAQERFHWDFGEAIQAIGIAADGRDWAASWDDGHIRFRHVANDDEVLARAQRMVRQTSGSSTRKRADTPWGAQVSADREQQALHELAIAAWGAYLTAKRQKQSEKVSGALAIGREALAGLAKLRELTATEVEWQKKFERGE